MYKNKTISLILPCRNEGEHLEDVIGLVPAVVDEIIVVSNNSTDDTIAVGRKLGVIVLEDNRTIRGIGYGFAHMTGIARASGDIIIGADGDGTYPLAQIPNLVKRFLAEGYDVASCNRYPLQPGTQVSPFLRLGVWVLGVETRLLYGVRIKDILSGMWIMRQEAKTELRLTCGDWNLSPQIKINAATDTSITYGELPISQAMRMGISHQRYLTTGWSHLKWIAGNWLAGRAPERLLRGDTQDVFVQMVRYGVVASVALVIDIGLLYAFVRGLHLFYIVAASCSYALSMLVNYALCLAWVFRGRQRALGLVSFCVVGVIGLGITDILMWIFTNGLGTYYMTSKILATGLVFFWSFGARRYLSQRFREPSRVILPVAEGLAQEPADTVN